MRTLLTPPESAWMRRVEIRDGINVLLRPIRANDEALWIEMISECSSETIHRRFGCLFQRPTHDMVVRYCDNDYQNEMAVVASVESATSPHMIGVGRLVADTDHREAEFALLVSDPWQGHGIGSLLMDDCLSNAPHWGVERVFAEVAPTNTRMLGMFRRRGFAMDYSVASDVVIARKQLCQS